MSRNNIRESVYLSVWAKRIKAIDFLGNKCEKCGENNPLVLAFHHVNPKQKSDDINSIVQSKSHISSKWSELKKELQKCILLCHNCHVELHHPSTNLLKVKLIELKGVNACERCGYSNKESMSSLEFHHNGDKEFRLSNKYGYRNRHFTIPLEDMILEMDKCIVICKNCHILEHSDVEKFERNKEKIFGNAKKYIERMSWDRDKIKKLYGENITLSRIANNLGCSLDTIRREIDRMIKLGLIRKREQNGHRNKIPK